MKRVFAMILALVMVLCMSTAALADAFVKSPSGNKAPRMIAFRPMSEDCTAELVVTAYADRDELDAASEQEIEDAYVEIKAADDASELNVDLAALAERLGIPAEELAVSDLFDATLRGCTVAEHEHHGSFTIEIEADTLDRFVGLLHFHNDEWELVEASVSGDVLTFTVDSLSPFAVVVQIEDGVPSTGDNRHLALWAGLMVASGAAVVLFLVKSKKETA